MRQSRNFSIVQVYHACSKRFGIVSHGVVYEGAVVVG